MLSIIRALYIAVSSTVPDAPRLLHRSLPRIMEVLDVSFLAVEQAPLAATDHGCPITLKSSCSKRLLLLEHELAHELPAEIKKAVAMGDLSENAEYHMAKQRQEFVNARLGQLKRRMAELSLVNLANIPRDKAASVPRLWSTTPPRKKRLSTAS